MQYSTYILYTYKVYIVQFDRMNKAKKFFLEN